VLPLVTQEAGAVQAPVVQTRGLQQVLLPVQDWP